MWALGWEGPENNVGTGTLWDKQDFQACCHSSSLLPGTGAVGAPLSPEPLASVAPSEMWDTGCSQEPHLSICLLTAFWKLGAAKMV